MSDKRGLILIGLLISFFATTAIGAEDSKDVIRIGLRADAAPFSYLGKAQAQKRQVLISEIERHESDLHELMKDKPVSKPEKRRRAQKIFHEIKKIHKAGTAIRAIEASLQSYRGYMVTICSAVLNHLTARGGEFHDYEIKVVQVDAKARFDLLNGTDNTKGGAEVDILCGPDSITEDRLHKNVVSHPLFLSGVSYAGHRVMPAGGYCGQIVGLVGGTTAAHAGLSNLIAAGKFFRYRQDLEKGLSAILSGRGGSSQVYEAAAYCPSGGYVSGGYKDRAIALEAAAVKAEAEAEAKAETEGDPSAQIAQPEVQLTTSNGPNNGPIREYKNHDEGIKAFCRGEVLYYVADIDIMRFKFQRFNADPQDDSTQCKNLLVSPYTVTRELYAAFFRKAKKIDANETEPKYDSFDARFYTAFNNRLLQLMQAGTNILEVAFRAAFSDYTMTPDLKQFFESSKIARSASER